MEIKKVEHIARIASAHNRAIVDLLIEKGIFTKEELRQKTIQNTALTEGEFDSIIADIAKD